MVDTPSLALAFTAGFISFVSPCCLPLVPGYLATVAGVRPDERRTRVDPRVLARSGVFVGTFSLIFVLFGLGATAAGDFLFDNQPLLNDLAGALSILMGVLFIASIFIARLRSETSTCSRCARPLGRAVVTHRREPSMSLG